jgi:hypothetical protein
VLSDAFDNARQVRQNVFIRESKHDVALRHEPCIATNVRNLPCLKIVGFTIELDDESRGVADKIGDISSDRCLAAEAETVDAVCLDVPP